MQLIFWAHYMQSMYGDKDAILLRWPDRQGMTSRVETLSLIDLHI